MSGKTLDLSITRSSDSRLIRDVQPDAYFSDHCSVLFSINTSKPQLSRKEVSFRKTKAFDTTAFIEDLSASRLCQIVLKEAKSTFLAEFIDLNADHQGKLFRAVKDLLVEKNTLCFSDYADKSVLANDLGRYFVKKVTRLRDELNQ